MSGLLQSFFTLREHLRATAELAGRPSECVRLLAVSKRQSALQIRQLFALGQTSFGESYLQEALEKMDELSDLAIEWHYIGPLQSNKTRLVASHFDWVQSIDSEKLLMRLSKHRPGDLPPLNVLLQINIDNEAQKRGIHAKELLALAQQTMELDGLRLRGLMAIPEHNKAVAEQQQSFKKMASLFQQIKPISPYIDTLSMGMSADLDTAIAAGSTMVRVGTLLFGQRG